ncbi:TetR/AcrR family transcriptional regulator [Clostridium swellfunianum]|uniref:TetR/AcrR family transcriptional regulator n=1 Tax=Clostridium swellfunianum TaxID=1367462 RepID=UPI00202E8DCA|nr:TetR/AcrR family transcriptional regulator [Clostridium swellfunianum]MCM0650066.1 TetR/AcrR family transcriptional regulator [Clostridium swellfunianum]
MNQAYFQLPLDKQRNLLNSGYKLFALYPYKKASMSAIASEADISKSLLFYYFKDKKEYYLFLFNTAIDFLDEQKEEGINKQMNDFFQLINKTVERRMKMIHDYPYLYKFITRAYYESLEEIKPEIDKRKKILLQIGEEEMLNIIDYDKFKNPSDVKILLDIVLSVAEGCMRGLEDLDISKMQEKICEFKSMMDSLKKYYYKEEFLIKL